MLQWYTPGSPVRLPSAPRTRRLQDFMMRSFTLRNADDRISLRVTGVDNLNSLNSQISIDASIAMNCTFRGRGVHRGRARPSRRTRICMQLRVASRARTHGIHRCAQSRCDTCARVYTRTSSPCILSRYHRDQRDDVPGSSWMVLHESVQKRTTQWAIAIAIAIAIYCYCCVASNTTALYSTIISALVMAVA